MQTALKIIGLTGKGLSLIAGLASYNNMIPEKWLPIALMVFGISSVLKDTVIHIGDYLDDGQNNSSFKP